jgi:hypothetical protein
MDLSVAAATLEALTSGWPETPGLSQPRRMIAALTHALVNPA